MTKTIPLVFLCVPLATAFAQDVAPSGEPVTPEEPPPSLTIRVTAIGGVPPERFTKDPKLAGEVTLDQLKAAGAQIPPPPGAGAGGSGETEGPGGQKPPRDESGVFMLPERPEDYPPRPLFVGTSDDSEKKFLWLTPGTLGARFALPWQPRVALFKSDPSASAATDKKPPSFYQVNAGETTTHLTLFLSESPGTDGWTKPRIIAMDSSPVRIPPGSTFFFNLSGLPLRCTVGGTLKDLASGSNWLVGSEARDARGMVRFSVESPGTPGKPAPVPVANSQRRLPEGDRLFVIAYQDRFAKNPLHRIRLLIYRDSTEPAQLAAARKPDVPG